MALSSVSPFRGLRLRLGLALAAACIGFAPAARADVWAYVDARGIAHFASEQLDDRYELFFRGGAPANPGGTPAAGADAAVLAGPGDATGNPGTGTGTGNWGSSPYAMRLATYIEGTAGYQLTRPLLQEAASTHGIDVQLLKALIATESGFDPQAISPKGAIGLMQVMPATAARFGVSGDARQPIERKLAEPHTNIRTGARYLRFLLNMFPNQLELALAAYNAGEGAVQRAGNRIPNFKETQNYVRTVMQLYALLKPPAPPAPAPRATTAPAPAAPLRTTMPGTVPGRGSMPPSLGNPLAGAMATIPAAAVPTSPN